MFHSYRENMFKPKNLSNHIMCSVVTYNDNYSDLSNKSKSSQFNG